MQPAYYRRNLMAKSDKKVFEVSETFLDPEAETKLPENHKVVEQEVKKSAKKDSAPKE